MELTVIGCSGSFAGPHSPASCYLLRGEDAQGRTWRILLDLGSGSLGAVQQQVDLEEIDGIFISHLHPDHCIDLAGLHIALCWDPRGWQGGRIPLVCPEDTYRYIAHTHGVDPQHGLTENLDFRPWRLGQSVQVGPFTVEAFPVLHPAPEAFAMRITHHGPQGTSVLAYSGDTDACPGLLQAAQDADLFLCEAAYVEGRDDGIRGVHLTGRRAGRAAAEAGARALLLTHLPVWNDPETLWAEAAETYQGPLGVAEAGRSYPVSCGSAPAADELASTSSR